jgi:signal transduction histidine kinase
MSESKVSLDKIVEILKQVEFFRSLHHEVVSDLAGKMTLKETGKNGSIIVQGEKGSSMYVIFSGEVKVHDKEYSIANLGKGSYFGEFSLLDDEPRSLSVTAIVPSVLGNIQQADFYSVLNDHPEITKDIIKVMLKRLRNQNLKIIEQLREKQKELEELVKIRTSDLRQKNEDLENTLNELRRTQEQLVHQAKLASLGQITAGIAHEIQNPLNFINNFSSISKELADELLSATIEEKEDIVSDLKVNLSKIEEHGKRADGIVKGMLLHSQSSKGVKQLVDILSLSEQAFNLAFNSLSTGFSDLKCELNSNVPEGILQIKIIPQDISRVLINIFNNALYSLNQKLKLKINDYIPSVSLTVTKDDTNVFIKIRDNGMGISKENTSKIFQPFFTTKPTGQGTGLGLSSGYEIVKAHGGEVEFNSEINEFAEFTVRLPLTGNL